MCRGRKTAAAGAAAVVTKFLDALAGKLAERWLALLVLPGALFVAVTAAAVSLRHRRWYDIALLRDQLTKFAADPASGRAGTVVLVVLGLLAAASAAGIAAQAVGAVAWRWWLLDSGGPVSRWLVRRRTARWDRATRKFEAALLTAGRAQLDDAATTPDLVRAAERLSARRGRIALARPTRPCWLGDRIAAADRRVLSRYGLDLASAWPRLWLVVPDTTRTEVASAQAATRDAARLTGWAVGYLLLGVIWWPSAVIGALTAVAAWRRTRVAGDTLAELIESTVDVHGRALAQSLGIACEDPLTAEVGEKITELLRKGA